MSVHPCFAHCGQPACNKLGCVRVYNDTHGRNPGLLPDEEGYRPDLYCTCAADASMSRGVCDYCMEAWT